MNKWILFRTSLDTSLPVNKLTCAAFFLTKYSVSIFGYVFVGQFWAIFKLIFLFNPALYNAWKTCSPWKGELVKVPSYLPLTTSIRNHTCFLYHCKSHFWIRTFFSKKADHTRLFKYYLLLLFYYFILQNNKKMCVQFTPNSFRRDLNLLMFE